MSSGLISSFEDGTATKTMHVGMAAAAALRAVSLATHGITGPGMVFEGRFGWFRSFVQTTRDFNFAALTDDLGDDWQVLNIASKTYPCAYTMMPHIAAALALREKYRFDPGEITEVRCFIMPRSFPIVCEPVGDKRRPATSWHGRISLQHTVAESLVLGRMDKNAYAPGNLRNPLINALADKVRHLADHEAMANLQRSRGTVAITLQDGRELSHTIDDMPGTRHNPNTAADYVAKFRSNVDGVLTPDVADQTMETLLALERIEDVTRLFDRLSGRPTH
jgi:2-methylcitrate dehydratase PrpD